MNNKQKLTALALSLSLLAGQSALAYNGAPASQFGFKGWPYRQTNSCNPLPQPDAPQATATPYPTTTPEPNTPPVIAPTQKPQTTVTPQKPVVSTPPSTGDDYTTPSLSVQEENAFNLLNKDRIANGLAPLALDPALSAIARAKSRDMHENKYFAHTSPTYGSVPDMLRHFGYSFASVAENIAHHATVEKSQAAFMSSDGHRRNLLGSQWSKVGIGVWTDNQGFVYVTQLFVR